MRSLNSKPITEAEADHLALVKSVGCVYCTHTGPTEGHHPKGCQGLHYCAISVCPDCHELRVWTYCGMTELEGLNETLRRVDCKLRGDTIIAKPAAYFSRQHSTRTPDKICPRRA